MHADKDLRLQLKIKQAQIASLNDQLSIQQRQINFLREKLKGLEESKPTGKLSTAANLLRARTMLLEALDKRLEASRRRNRKIDTGKELSLSRAEACRKEIEELRACLDKTKAEL